MKVNYATTHPHTNEVLKAQTGKTFEEWFAAMDGRGGPDIGRRELFVFLYHESKVDLYWCAALNHHYEAHHGIKDKSGRAKGYNVCSTKTITAPLEAVYGAWSTQSGLKSWFGDNSVAEVKDGGEFNDGDGQLGTYKRVRENKDLRFTWVSPKDEIGSIVDVIFQDKGNGKSYVQITHDRIQSPDEADGLRAAWGEALNRLKSYLEN